jgi:hypothetical protein
LRRPAQPADPATGLPDLPPFVYLPPGGTGFIRLPTDTLKPWMAALLELVGDRSHDFSGDSLKLSRLDAMRTTAALGEGAVWEGAQALRAMVQQLSGRAEMPEVPVPASVQASLRPYQQQGLNWLQFLRTHGLGGILADDMGLGKTLQTLAHIQVEKDAGRLTHPALIIAPVSLMGNWRREAERFCPQLRCWCCTAKTGMRWPTHGPARHRHRALLAAAARQGALAGGANGTWWCWTKRKTSKTPTPTPPRWWASCKTRHRLCLSGTPMENHLGEIWSLFHFLMPGFLGSQQRFKELFRNPSKNRATPSA